MTKAISFSKIKSPLEKAAPGVVFALLLIQPFLDVISYWATEWEFTGLTTLFRFAMFASVMLYSFLISDKKRVYVIFGGVLCIYWLCHMIACIKSQGGYVSPVSDVNNFLRTVHLPLFTLAFITMFKKSDEVPVYVQKAFLINLIVMLHFLVLSYMTGTQVYTYVYNKVGLMGWASVHNSQSAILAFVVPLILLFAYKTKSKIFFYAASVVSFINLFFVGTKVDYFSIIIIAVGFAIMLVITGEKDILYYAILFALVLISLLCYKTSTAYDVMGDHTASMEQKQDYLEVLLDPADTEKPIEFEENQSLSSKISREIYDALDPMTKYNINSIYHLYLGPVVQRYGFDRVFEKYDYSLVVSNLTATRQKKRFFAEMAWEDSDFFTKCFGYEYVTLIEDYTYTDYKGVERTTQYVFDLENDFPSVYYYSGYVGTALYALFIAYIACLVLISLIKKFKETLTVENGVVGITIILMLSVSQFSGNVLRRPNASIYVSVILAYAYYLTAIKQGVGFKTLFQKKKKEK